MSDPHSNPNPVANPGQFAAERDVNAMREMPSVVAARLRIQALFVQGFADRIPLESRPLLPAFCDEYLNNWLFKGAASDTQYPRVVRDFMPAYQWHGHDVVGARTGGDNPDNCYRVAAIQHGCRYRLRGRYVEGRATSISYTLTANYGTSQTIQTIEDHQIEVDAEGCFEILIDDRPDDGAANHMTTRPGVKFMFVRDSMMDWGAETPHELSIERLGDANAEPVSLEAMADRAVEHALNDFYLYFWFQNVWSGMTPNTMTPAKQMQAASGGLITQAQAHGTFHLGPDDAAILEYDPVEARYTAVQLTEWLYRSLDYQLIQSSLSGAQSHVDDDGIIRLVIARRDPGVHNWLDTGGQERVHSIMRWQHMKKDGRPVAATLRLTTIDRLRSALPAGTRWVDAAQRQAQLSARLDAYRRRIV